MLIFSLIQSSLGLANGRDTDLIRPILQDNTFMRSAQVIEEDLRQRYMRFVELRNTVINK